MQTILSPNAQLQSRIAQTLRSYLPQSQVDFHANSTVDPPANRLTHHSYSLTGGGKVSCLEPSIHCFEGDSTLNSTTVISRIKSLLQSKAEPSALDITAQWNQQHEHLKPLTQRLTLSPSETVDCPLCGSHQAIRVRAHLRFGPDYWTTDSSVHHCASCQRYALSAQDHDAHMTAAEARFRHPGSKGQLSDYQKLSTVEARLWSQSPTVLNLEPTTRCNFNCWYCIGRSMKQEDIDFDGFLRALDNFPTLQILALVGEGEPLLHKRFFDMVRAAKERGVRVVTISNGSPFSESVIKKLCEAEVDYISISIDSTSAENFAQSRIDGDLNRVWEGIERLTSYRNANGYKYPLIGLKGTLFDHTRNEMPAIVEEAKRRGVDMVESFQALNPKQTYVDIYPKDKVYLLRNASDIAKQIGQQYQSVALPSIAEFAQREQMAIGNCGPTNGLRANCNEEWIYSLLSGDVTPCCQIKQPMDDHWNIFQHSIGDILANPHYENVRFNLWNGIFLESCKGCSKVP